MKLDALGPEASVAPEYRKKTIERFMWLDEDGAKKVRVYIPFDGLDKIPAGDVRLVRAARARSRPASARGQAPC